MGRMVVVWKIEWPGKMIVVLYERPLEHWVVVARFGGQSAACKCCGVATLGGDKTQVLMQHLKARSALPLLLLYHTSFNESCRCGLQ